MIKAELKKTNSTLIIVQQLRQKIGVVFGNPETTSGGNALKFYSSVRMDIRRIGSVKGKSKKKDKDGKRLAKIVGNKVRVKIIKNKLAPPMGFQHSKKIADLFHV